MTGHAWVRASTHLDWIIHLGVADDEGEVDEVLMRGVRRIRYELCLISPCKSTRGFIGMQHPMHKTVARMHTSTGCSSEILMPLHRKRSGIGEIRRLATRPVDSFVSALSWPTELIRLAHSSLELAELV